MNAIRLLPLCAPIQRWTTDLPWFHGTTAADILVDREDSIAYKQLGRHPKDPTMAPVL